MLKLLFQTDNNSFFSSNTFQKISNVVSVPQNSQSANVTIDWTTTALSSIPDSLPTVHSTEDWQAAFGFQPEKRSSNPPQMPPQSPTASPSVPFSAEAFLDDEDYLESQYGPKLPTDFDPSDIITTSTSKFMADFQQNSLQQRLSLQARQNHENCEYIKQNGHNIDPKETNDIKVDDDLGFDPFHETQKALAELMENEMQLKQQRLLQQQQQQNKRRHNLYFHNNHNPQQNQQMHQREDSRNHQKMPPSLAPQHFTQVPHLAHLHQAHQLQNIQVIQQSHSLLSRLPGNMIPTGNQSPVQPSMPSIGQRSRLPPPGFPGSTPNHMNSFGLGIPRAAPTNPAPQTPYLPNGNSLIGGQGIHKCGNDGVFGIKDWCEINGQQAPGHPFNHPPVQQKGWNNFGPNADWTSIDPAIVSSSRPVPFQTTSTWQFPRIHQTSHNVPHNAQQEQSAPAQHWAMQPPPGFGGPSSTQLNGQQSSTTAQSHTKLISAGPEIENL